MWYIVFSTGGNISVCVFREAEGAIVEPSFDVRNTSLIAQHLF
jgi:hypothetical protein